MSDDTKRQKDLDEWRNTTLKRVVDRFPLRDGADMRWLDCAIA